MARFQSGTLGRSIKRFGRFQGRMPSFKRKQHAFVYSTLDEAALDRTGAVNEFVLFDRTDFSPAASANASHCRNVSFDIMFGITWSPQVTTLAYDSWRLDAAIFIMDADDVGGNITTQFASNRAIAWNSWARNTGEQPSALGASPDIRYINWRCKGRARYIRIDEELRFLLQFNSSVTDTLIDARLSLMSRYSWEIP